MNKTEPNHLSLTQREQLRKIVTEACGPIGPYWPMKTFAYYNPLRDLEHFPFAEAIGKAQHLLGGQGFLPPEEYRKLFHQGRITQAAVARALQRVGPPLPSPARQVTLGGGDLYPAPSHYARFGYTSVPASLHQCSQ